MANKAMAPPPPPQIDFSFPTITNTSPCFIESPPMWGTTSGSLESPRSHDASTKRDKNQEENLDMSPLISNKANYSINQTKSFTCIEGAAAMKRIIEDESHDEEKEEEEKMDMLWENFNEESNQMITRGYGRVKDTKKCTSPDKMVEFKCVQALNLSKASKRPSLVVLIRVLKKVFLLSTSPTSFKKTKL